MIRACLALVVICALAGPALAAPADFVYHPNDYRRGEVAHVWPKHGVWEVVLDAGGSDGADTCEIATKAGANEPTFFLAFSDDGSPGGELTVDWADTNFDGNRYGTADPTDPGLYTVVVDHTGLRVVPPAPPNAPAWEQGHNADLLGSWQIFRVPRMGSIGRINGLRFYIVKDWLVAWNMPNRDAKSPFRGDGPNALSADQLLSRIAKGAYLRFHDQPMAFRYIPLAGFGSALKDMHACQDALAGD